MIAVIYPEQATDVPAYQRNNKGNVKIYGQREDVLRVSQCRSEASLLSEKGAVIVDIDKKEQRRANGR